MTNKARILGLCGARGAGKDTAANVLVQGGFKRIAFADGIYKEVAEAFDVSIEFLQHRPTKETPLPELSLKNCRDALFVDVMLDIDVEKGTDEENLERSRSPREILQRWGTDYKRKYYGDDYWRKQVVGFIQADSDARWVVTDVRHHAELKILKALDNMATALIYNPDALAASLTSTHPSDIEMAYYPAQRVFYNRFDEVGLATFKYSIALEYLGLDSEVTQHYQEVFEKIKKIDDASTALELEASANLAAAS